MIALYPGAYKPPHKGHFTVVKRLLDGNHNGVVYDIDNYLQAGEKALKGDKVKSQKVDKVVVFIGGNTRNGITPEHAETIWNIYKKYLGNVEIVKGEKNPMYASSKYAKANPNEKFYAIAGIRDEDDLVDLKRVTTFKNRENVDGLVVSGDGVDQRASIIRGLTLAGNTRLRNYFPDEISDEEFEEILNIMKSSTIDENISNAIESTFSDFFTEEVENVKEETKGKLELKDYIASVVEYMLDEGMNITPLPEIKTIRDEANAANFFGRTAHYSPTEKEVVLYIEGRHQKDIVRSFVHEMIHHMQNLEGRLNHIDTTNTNEDDNLLEIEKEAYTLGNITFRNWEDKIKNKGYEK